MIDVSNKLFMIPSAVARNFWTLWSKSADENFEEVFCIVGSMVWINLFIFPWYYRILNNSIIVEYLIHYTKKCIDGEMSTSSNFYILLPCILTFSIWQKEFWENKMASNNVRNQALSLYKSLLRESGKIESYNFR